MKLFTVTRSNVWASILCLASLSAVSGLAAAADTSVTGDAVHQIGPQQEVLPPAQELIIENSSLRLSSERAPEHGKGLHLPLPEPVGEGDDVASSSETSSLYHDLPSVSGEYSVGGHTLRPYVGAGYGSGYTSELDRSLNGVEGGQTDPTLRNQLGQGLTPNEVRMGIQIPFN